MQENWRMCEFKTGRISLRSLQGENKTGQIQSYCGWLKFRGVPIFVVFVDGPIHEFQYPRISNFLYEL